MRGDDDFFSVARTMPFVALIPSEVTPWLTALSAYSGHCQRLKVAESSVRCPYLSERAFHWEDAVSEVKSTYGGARTNLGEKVVREKL